MVSLETIVIEDEQFALHFVATDSSIASVAPKLRTYFIGTGVGQDESKNHQMRNIHGLCCHKKMIVIVDEQFDLLKLSHGLPGDEPFFKQKVSCQLVVRGQLGMKMWVSPQHTMKHML